MTSLYLLARQLAKTNPPKTNAQRQREYRARHPERVAARARVGCAVRSGTLVPEPCVECGSTVGVEAHHPDYARPLDVRWLCEKCHRREHVTPRQTSSPTDHRRPVSRATPARREGAIHV